MKYTITEIIMIPVKDWPKITGGGPEHMTQPLTLGIKQTD